MKITKFEQSGFILEAKDGFTLALDIGNKTPVERLAGLSVDAMVVSHIHGDHFYLESIKALSPKTLYLNTECADALSEESLVSEIVRVKVGDVQKIGNFVVHFFNVDHGPHLSVPLAENFGLLIEGDDEKIYFCGDMCVPSGMPVDDLSVDYILLPVGGYYTFDPQEAFDFAKQFKKIQTIIPMHFEKNNFVDPIRRDEFVEIAKNNFMIDIL